MRLVSLQLTRYGNFAAHRIDFDPRPGRVNLLFAPNGAGKSVLRQAFCDLLFGIGGQTPMGFRYGYSGMRITAEAVAPDGTPVAFGRRKGVGNTLVDGAGNQDVSGTLSRLLGHTDRTLLERLFALDTERLRRGGEELLASGGAVADALLAAGGLRGAKLLRQSLEAAADALAPAKRSGQRPFYRALDGWQEARRRASAALLRPDEWVRMERELTEAEAQQAQHNQAAATVARQMAQLQRLRRVRAPMAERAAAEAWLAAHPDAPDLAPSLADRLAEAVARLAAARQQLEQEGERWAELAGELAGIAADAAVVAAAAEIERLSEEAGAVGKALSDLPNLDGEHTAVLARIAASLRRLGSDLPPARAAEVIPNRAAESRVRSLIASHGAVAVAAAQAPTAVAAAARDIAQISAELEALPPSASNDALDPLVAEIRTLGDPAARAEEASRAVAESRAALAAALAAVPAWRGSAEALLALSPLPLASYERLDAAHRTAEAERVRRADQARSANQQCVQAARRLAAITAGTDVADETAVAETRRHRDAGWQLIYRIAFTADRPSADEQRSFAREWPLPLAYEQAVQAADRLSDRRVLEADLVARAAEARRAQAEAEAAQREADEILRPAEREAADALRRWTEACAALPLGNPPELAEVRTFLAARERVIERRAAVGRDEQSLTRLEARHAEWAARLRDALAPLISPGPTLAALLAEADARLAAASRVAKQRIALEASLRELQRSRQAAEAALAEAERNHADWQADWQSALSRLGRPAGEHPQVTADILALLAELERDMQVATQLGERVGDMQTDNNAFSVAVGSVLDAASPDLVTADRTTAAMLSALSTLRDRLREHRARMVRRAELQKQIEQADIRVEQLKHRVEQREMELQAVLAAIGAGSVEDAEQRLAASRERAAHADGFARSETKLLEDGDGLSIAQLRAELDASPADDIAAALVAAEAAMAAANTAAQDAAGSASRHKLQMDQRATDVAFETAIGDQHAAIAAIGRVLEEAMLARLAASLLGRAMEAVEEQGGSVLLTRIGQYFRTLSGGAYSRIVTQDDGVGGLALAAVPSDLPDELKRVGELSEGTRDQLYLALRLATIEDHVATAPPLPFIGDDILQTSDDDRATAALHALLELSHHVQVILLTHHPHILHLARSLPDGAVQVCRIASATATAA